MAKRKFVPTVLAENDRLAGGPEENDLSRLYLVTPLEIAANNGVPPTLPALEWQKRVDEWVLSVGGERLPSGRTTRFLPGNIINLPSGGPRKSAADVVGGNKDKWGPLVWVGGSLVVLALIAGGFYAIRRFNQGGQQ